MDLIQIENLIAGRGERPFAPIEEWRSYLILIPYLTKLFTIIISLPHRVTLTHSRHPCLDAPS